MRAPVIWHAEALWEAVVPLLPGFTVEIAPELPSTNSALMQRARSGDGQPTLLVAEQQTAGRGRLGRAWQSEAGSSLTFSLGMPLAPQDWSGLSLAVGISLAESLHPDLRLKWPNDLWLNDRKLAGILIETASTVGAIGAGAPRYAVIGVGVNVHAPDPQGLSTAPASLQELLPGMDAPGAMARVLLPLVQAIQAFETSGFSPLQARFNARDALRGREVNLSDGVAGTAHGVDGTGAMLVHTADGMKQITSSEISVRPQSAPKG